MVEGFWMKNIGCGRFYFVNILKCQIHSLSKHKPTSYIEIECETSGIIKNVNILFI